MENKITLRRELILKGIMCPYCGKGTEYVDAIKIYPHRSDIEGKFYACFPCEAWVGTHKDEPTKSYGRLADAPLRKLKSEVHKVFDPLWMKSVKEGKGAKFTIRNRAYKWLHEQMESSLIREHCHIGMFNQEQCNEAIRICKPYFDKLIKNKS